MLCVQVWEEVAGSWHSLYIIASKQTERATARTMKQHNKQTAKIRFVDEKIYQVGMPIVMTTQVTQASLGEEEQVPYSHGRQLRAT
jgi:hypothetical protein